MTTLSEAAQLLAAHDSIVLLTHQNPDGDTLGSAFALCYALTAQGKSVQVRCPDPIPGRFSFLQRDYVSQELTDAYVVAVDVASPSLLGHLWKKENPDPIDLCIDHHPSNSGYAEEYYVDPTASATCEIIYSLLAEMGITPTPLVADCLYTGIATDSGCFRFSNTTAKTHRIAAELFDLGARTAWINEHFFERKSRERIEVEKCVLNTIEFFHQGRIALIEIPLSLLKETGADESELDGVSAIPRTIDGVVVGITIRQKEDDVYKVSLRTTAEIDASAVCAVFGGGGHARAAGCLLRGDYETVKYKLVEECARHLK